MIRRERGIGDERQKLGVLGDDPARLITLLRNEGAGQALAAFGKEPPGSFDPFDDLARNNREADNLRMRMLLRRAGIRAVILEHDYMPHARVPVKLHEPMAVGLQNPLHMRDLAQRHGHIVLRTFDQHLVKANAIHARFTRRGAARPRHLAGRGKDRELVDDGAENPPAIVPIEAKSFDHRPSLHCPDKTCNSPETAGPRPAPSLTRNSHRVSPAQAQ